MKPDFFIVGAPKCGTTALYEYLRAHPQIYMSPVKEPHFFGSDLKLRWRPTKSQYFSYFAMAKNEKRVGEASVRYLYSKCAAAEIKEFCPEARIIIMLRNPVDMIYSRHSQNIFAMNDDIKDFEVSLEAEEDQKLDLRVPRDAKSVEQLFYRDAARYSEQVQRYFEAFGRENVHVIVYDDFKDDTASVYRETLRFLDVDQEFQPRFEVKNANKVTRSRILQWILQNRRSPLIRAARLLLPFRFRMKVSPAIQILYTSYVPRPPMDPELRRRLQAEFAPEVGRLSELLGRDLTHWSLPAESALEPESEAPAQVS